MKTPFGTVLKQWVSMSRRAMAQLASSNAWQGQSLVLSWRSWASRVSGTWLLGFLLVGYLSGCMPCWAFHCPLDCRVAKEKNGFLFFKQFHLENGTVRVHKAKRYPWFNHHTSTPMLGVSYCVDKGRLVQCEGAVGVWWQWLPLLFSFSPQTLQSASWENCTWHMFPLPF